MRLFRSFLAAMALSLLASCGGGSAGCNVFTDPACGGDTGTGSGTDTQSATLTLALSSTTVSAASPATVTATVRSASGAGIEGAVVSFGTENSLGSFSSTSGLTDANGRAVVSLTPADATSAGADEVVATVVVSGDELTARTGFQLSATEVGIASVQADIAGADILGAGGQATITATLSGTTVGTPVTVTASSACVSAGRATLTPASQSVSNGVATFTYVNTSCGSTDGSEASDEVLISVVGGTATDSVVLPIAARNAASIAFVSASPEQIFLAGSGYDEVAFVTFEVRDEQGQALPAQDVSMELTTFSGGLLLDGGDSAVVKKSDSSGRVSVRINAGTVPTPVRVRATLVDSSITTVSSNLTVAVGLPSQLNFSLSQQTLNIEGYDIDGTSNRYTIIASDRLGNPVPAGTTINYIVEGGGQIQSSRQIAIDVDTGLASATASYQTSEPRPVDGRITVVAYALGEESFIDTDGDNVWDASEAFQDLGDVFVNRDLVGAFDASVDQRIPLAGASTRNCSAPTNVLLRKSAAIPSVDAGTCDATWSKSVYVRRAAETVLSTSSARPLWPVGFDAGDLLDDGSGDSCPVAVELADSATTTRDFLLFGGTLQGVATRGTIGFIVADANPGDASIGQAPRLNPMAAGTVLSVTTTSGLSASVAGGSPVPSTTEATPAAISYSFSDSTTSGTVFVRFTSPSGLVTTVPLSLTTSAGASCPN